MNPHAHRGQALLAVILLALVLGAGSLLADGGLRARAEARAHARSLAALAEARSALIGYAISYAERHPGEGYGFLPCPDGGNDGSTDLGACGARDSAAFGRLPWRTLGLPELRDGWGECLWYAVAGSVKHNPKPLSLNWDSPGQFDLRDAGGEALPLATIDGRAVAVIFAPGPARAGQLRPHGRAIGCSGSDAVAADLTHYLDHPYPRVSADPVTITLSRLQAGDASAANDVVAWVDIDEIFAALARRSDQPAYLDGLIARAAGALSARLSDAGRADWLAARAPRHGALHTAPLPPAIVLELPADERAELDRWRDQMRFAACPEDEACITVQRSDGTERCAAVLGFAGERLRTGPTPQQRSGAVQRADPAQYFEGRNAHGFADGVALFEGARAVARAPSTPSTPSGPATSSSPTVAAAPTVNDVILCLP